MLVCAVHIWTVTVAAAHREPMKLQTTASLCCQTGNTRKHQAELLQGRKISKTQ